MISSNLFWGYMSVGSTSQLSDISDILAYIIVNRLHVTLLVILIDAESHGNPTSSLDTLLALLETEAAKTEESSEVTMLQ